MKVTKHSCYVCGDYNIDLLKVKTKNHYSEYLDEVVSQGFIPRITLPTRISEQSSTLIDNIYTNNIDEGESSGILLNQISDHQMIFTLTKKFSYVTQVTKFVEIQINDPDSIQNFVNELDELNNNRKKHKMAKWMTNGILKSINTKDKLYKKLVKMDVDGNA